jgi:hypothetical protein
MASSKIRSTVRAPRLTIENTPATEGTRRVTGNRAEEPTAPVRDRRLGIEQLRRACRLSLNSFNHIIGGCHVFRSDGEVARCEFLGHDRQGVLRSHSSTIGCSANNRYEMFSELNVQIDSD